MTKNHEGNDMEVCVMTMPSRLVVAALVASALVLAGCGGNGIERTDLNEKAQKQAVSDRFMCDRSTYVFETVVDSRTGVTYLLWKDAYNSHLGGITVLLNSDGSPVISEEYTQ